jgi:putative ABC transport system permease protein
MQCDQKPRGFGESELTFVRNVKTAFRRFPRTKSVSDQISSLGSNLLIVMPGQRFGASQAGASAPSLRLSDAEAIRAQVSGLKAVAPTASQSATAVSAARNWTTTVTGTTDDYFTAGG